MQVFLMSEEAHVYFLTYHCILESSEPCLGLWITVLDLEACLSLLLQRKPSDFCGCVWMDHLSLVKLTPFAWMNILPCLEGFRTRTVLHSFLLTGSDKAFSCIEKHWESSVPHQDNQAALSNWQWLLWISQQEEGDAVFSTEIWGILFSIHTEEF